MIQQFNTTPIITNKDFDELNPKQDYYGPKPVVLLILDGWGIGPKNAGNAIERAQTPNIDSYWLKFPHTQLGASGEYVGLPKDEDGNTETGHLNMGAGTIVYQNLPRIDTAILDRSFFNNHALINTCKHVQQHKSKLHIMGLIGEGEVHSNIEHLYALLNLVKEQGVTEVYIHGFTDGRDSPPTAGIETIKNIQKECQKIGVGKIASLTGRYYAMDRDKRWDRIGKTYHALVLGEGLESSDPVTAINEQYARDTTDEFIEPVLIVDESGQKNLVSDSDAVIFFNYRIDRPRELTRAFTLSDFEKGTNPQFDPYSEEGNNPRNTSPENTFQRKKILKNLYFTTMTQYEKHLPVDVAFSPQLIENPICKVFSDFGLRQLRMSETEKERFVTYSMNGQKNIQYPGEDRIIIPSKGVKSYDEIPEMSAYELANAMLEKIAEDKYDVIIANFANPDMVAHTGNLQASIKTCEITDEIVGRIVNAVYPKGGVILITGDHGNVEELINNQTGKTDTEHSNNPVPLLIIGKRFESNPATLPQGILSDVAPTILSIMGIQKPSSMTGRALI
ncbi:MAG: 2,3-bisphosphoglycerate-independent phosphoglycerate mutase [Patescibacteria group bacterium]